MSKTIVIVGEGNFENSRNSYVCATKEIKKDCSFKFISVLHGEYCEALEKIEKIILLEKSTSIFIFEDYNTSKDFKRRLVRNLNRRKARLRKVMEKTEAYSVNLKKGITEPFFKINESDKKQSARRRNAA